MARPCHRRIEPRSLYPARILARTTRLMKRTTSFPDTIHSAFAEVLLGGVCTTSRFQHKRVCPLCGRSSETAEPWPTCASLIGAPARPLGLGRGCFPLQFPILESRAAIRHFAGRCFLLCATVMAHNPCRLCPLPFPSAAPPPARCAVCALARVLGLGRGRLWVFVLLEQQFD